MPSAFPTSQLPNWEIYAHLTSDGYLFTKTLPNSNLLRKIFPASLILEDTKLVGLVQIMDMSGPGPEYRTDVFAMLTEVKEYKEGRVPLSYQPSASDTQTWVLTYVESIEILEQINFDKEELLKEIVSFGRDHDTRIHTSEKLRPILEPKFIRRDLPST